MLSCIQHKTWTETPMFGSFNNRWVLFTNNWLTAAGASSQRWHKKGFPRPLCNYNACRICLHCICHYTNNSLLLSVLFVGNGRRIIRTKYGVSFICLCWYFITKRLNEILCTKEVEGCALVYFSSLAIWNLMPCLWTLLHIYRRIRESNRQPCDWQMTCWAKTTPLFFLQTHHYQWHWWIWVLKEVQMFYFRHLLFYFHGWTSPLLKIQIWLKVI